MVPATVRRRTVRTPERGREWHRSRRRTLQQRLKSVDDADLRLGTYAFNQRGRRERPEGGAAALRGRHRARARGRRERTRCSPRSASACRGLARRRRLGGRGARTCAITVQPRADRSLTAARCTAHASERPCQREREQYATAAGHRRSVQGARRRLAGLRAGAAPKSANATHPPHSGTLASTIEDQS